MLENRCLYELAPLEIMLLLRGAAEVVTPPPSKVPLIGKQMGEVERHTNSDVLIEEGKIVSIGRNIDSDGAEVLDVSGKVILPGFVDPHTHLVWSGSREHELELPQDFHFCDSEVQFRATIFELIAPSRGVLSFDIHYAPDKSHWDVPFFR